MLQGQVLLWGWGPQCSSYSVTSIKNQLIFPSTNLTDTIITSSYGVWLPHHVPKALWCSSCFLGLLVPRKADARWRGTWRSSKVLRVRPPARLRSLLASWHPSPRRTHGTSLQISPTYDCSCPRDPELDGPGQIPPRFLSKRDLEGSGLDVCVGLMFCSYACREMDFRVCWKSRSRDVQICVRLWIHFLLLGNTCS